MFCLLKFGNSERGGHTLLDRQMAQRTVGEGPGANSLSFGPCDDQAIAVGLPGPAQRSWCRAIVGGLSVAAMAKFIHLWHTVRDIQLSDASDSLRWRWTSDGAFSVHSAYDALHLPSQAMPWATLLWDTWAPLKTKLFLWLAFRRRHWTVDRRRRHGLDAHANCLLCDQEPETIDHIVVTCSYAKQIWWNIRAALNETSALRHCDNVLKWWEVWRCLWVGEYKQGADSIFALVAWEIWKERNARLFRGAVTQPMQLMEASIRHQAELWVQAGAKGLGSLLQRVQ